ncbi:MAG: hypothetical protein BWK76_22910 [Desulfobulbaceae bacterium A2]|nr:MAG: hypothetical protein BWK76_22910 [Desulfobulbaceae bacterium A2]
MARFSRAGFLSTATPDQRMAYLVLARRSRPQTFDEVVGQRVVVRTLQNALAANRVPHALMFSGVRGVGKTTLARIMAKALNCAEGPTPTPCNQCPSCREIGGGGSLDLHEIDGASNRGIQEIRELKEGLRFMPASSRYKIVIIDEVHMLTSEAFNALLKTLEEPPAHVFFVLATTEPHKVPVTIQSRCQRYELKRVSRPELSAHFSRLIEAEGVTMEPAALELIVRESEGSVRDGLSLLDQVLSYAGSSIGIQDVTDVLGVVDRELVLRLLEALLARDLGECLNLLEQVFAQGMDFKHFINALLDGCRALVICRVAREPARLLDLPEQELGRLLQLGAPHSVETLQALFDQLFDGCERAARAVRPRLALELALIRAVQTGAITPVGEILARLDRLLGEDSDAELAALSAQYPVTAPASLPPAATVSAARTVAAAVPAAVAAPAPASLAELKTAAAAPLQPESGGGHTVPHAVSGATPVAPPSGENLSAEAVAAALPAGEVVVPSLSSSSASLASGQERVMPEKKTAAAAPEAEHAAEKRIRQRWDGFIEYVKGRREWMAHTLRRCDGITLEDGKLIIRFQVGADCVLFQEKSHLKLLTEFALDYFQENLQISFKALDGISCSIAGENGSGPRQQRQKLANAPLVQQASEIFQGRIGDIRVGPRFRGHWQDSPAELLEGAGEGESE